MGFLCFGKKSTARPRGKTPVRIVPQLPTPSSSSLASRKPIPRETISPSQVEREIPHYVKFNSSEPIFKDSPKPKVKVDPPKATPKTSPPKPTVRASGNGSGYDSSSTTHYTPSYSYSGGGGGSSYGGGGDSGCSGGDSGGDGGGHGGGC